MYEGEMQVLQSLQGTLKRASSFCGTAVRRLLEQTVVYIWSDNIQEGCFETPCVDTLQAL